MFRDDDPQLAVVRRYALALPDVQEKVSHGRPAFFTTKVFAYFGGSVRLGIDLTDLDEAELGELLDASYRRTAPTRLLRRLDVPTDE